MKLKTIKDIKKADISKYRESYSYQPKLTKELDVLKKPFNQSIINKIVLWKVNRYAELSDDVLSVVNRIDSNVESIKRDEKYEILDALLGPKGIDLPMASTILRFKNPKVFQIIDRRAYRILTGKPYKQKYSKKQKIEIYLDYLEQLRKKCKECGICFHESDRILYEADRALNKEINI